MFRRCLARQVPRRRPPRSGSDLLFSVQSSNSCVLRHRYLFRIPTVTSDNRRAACAEIFFPPLPGCWSRHSFRRAVNDASRLSPAPSDPFLTPKPAISYSSVVFPPPPMHRNYMVLFPLKRGTPSPISYRLQLLFFCRFCQIRSISSGPLLCFLFFLLSHSTILIFCCQILLTPTKLEKELPRSGRSPSEQFCYSY